MRREIIDRYTGPATPIIDVSAYQGEIDWPLVARSEIVKGGRRHGRPEAAIVRLADGVQTRRDSAPDPYAVRNLQGAMAAGLRVGGYIYVRAYHPADAQADLCIETLRVAGVPPGTPVALDVEGRPDDPRTPDTDESHGAWWRPGSAKRREPDDHLTTPEVLDGLERMAVRLIAAGYRPLWYGGAALHFFITARGLALPPTLATLDLWTAAYGDPIGSPRMPVGPRGEPAPWPYALIHQWTADARISGIRGPIDANVFRGDSEACAAWFDGPPGLRETRPDIVTPESIVGELAATHDRAHGAGLADLAADIRGVIGRHGAC